MVRHHSGYFYLFRALRSLRSPMMISRPYETTTQRVCRLTQLLYVPVTRQVNVMRHLRRALRVQETFQETGLTCVESSNRRIETIRGRYAVTALSKSIAMFSALDHLTRAATTKYGSTFHTPTLGRSTISVLATMSEASKTGGRARKEATHTTNCDHSLCAGERVIHKTIRNPTRPSAQMTASVHGLLIDEYPSSFSRSEFHEFGNLFRCPRAGVCVSLFSPSCVVTRPHPLTARMSLEVQGHRPATFTNVFFKNTVNELTVQLQELQDKANFLNGSTDLMILRRQAALDFPMFAVIL